MSPEPFDSRAKAPPAKRWEKGYGDENVFCEESFDKYRALYIYLAYKDVDLFVKGLVLQLNSWKLAR